MPIFRIDLFVGIFFLLLFLFRVPHVFAQLSQATVQNNPPFTIQGVITDEKGETLPGVVVFLSNTKKITSTDNNGEFRLTSLTPGNYELVAKMIGYGTFIKQITLQQQALYLNIKLQPNITQLNEVVVIPQATRTKYLKVFTRNFIGETVNASKCRILNPEVLKFKYTIKKNTLTVTADDFLVIENQGLGYRLKYLLNQFEYNYKTTGLFYSGQPYFEELTSTARQKKRWERARRISYNGSPMHFFRAVMRNNVTNEDFVVYAAKKRGSNAKTSISRSFPVNLETLWDITPAGNGLKYIRPKNEIYIVYTKGTDETINGLRYGQVTAIEPRTDSILTDEKGAISSPLLVSGYWAKKNVAELLPFTFKTPENVATPQPQQISFVTNKMVAAIDSFATKTPTEKVFIHIDRPFYTTGDTIWLKAYIFNGTLLPSKQSGILYTELINDTGRVVLQHAMPVKNGITFGQIALGEKLADGEYTLRAYTNWMQNQGEDSFYKIHFYISNLQNNWLINLANKTGIKDGVANQEVEMQLKTLDNEPARLKDLQLKVVNATKTLHRGNTQTDIEGKLRVNFNLPAGKIKQLTLIASEIKKNEPGQTLKIPLKINRYENTDLQFMPEGGHMVAGMPARIGFKAIGEDGLGADVKGNIVNSLGKVITSFQSAYKGIGAFNFTPQPGMQYSANIIFAQGIIRSYALPEVKSSGVTLNVTSFTDSAFVLVNVGVTGDILGLKKSYYLIAQNRGKVCYASRLTFKDKPSISVQVNKDSLVTGITRFTLLSDGRQPLAERLIFIDQEDELNINIKQGKPAYQLHDNIDLAIQVTDKYNAPVKGSYSLSVTDDSKINTDSINTPDIRCAMLLTSDLKGTVETPGYYFSAAASAQELDNLLLTQGWAGYSWDNVFHPPAAPRFAAEPDITIRGRIVRKGDKNVGGLTVTLLSTTSPVIFKDTISDSEGNFVFAGLPQADSANFIIHVKDKKGSIFEAEIEMDSFKPAAPPTTIPAVFPWYVNTKSTLLNNINKKIAFDDVWGKLNNGKLLSEVRITAKKAIKGSHNLNGPGMSDQALHPEDVERAGKMSLRELLNKKVKGFGKRLLKTQPGASLRAYYVIYDKQVKFIIDGMDADMYYSPAYERPPRNPDSLVNYDHFNYQESVIDYLKTADIKGIEVMYNGSFTGQYNMSYLQSPAACWTCLPPIYTKLAYIEITTWAGIGLAKRRHGSLVYRPIPINWPKQFYKPKYTPVNNLDIPEFRPVLHWEPDISLDTNGAAHISFYTGDAPAIYTIILQGTDMNGNVGVKRKKLVIKNK